MAHHPLAPIAAAFTLLLICATCPAQQPDIPAPIQTLLDRYRIFSRVHLEYDIQLEAFIGDDPIQTTGHISYWQDGPHFRTSQRFEGANFSMYNLDIAFDGKHHQTFFHTDKSLILSSTPAAIPAEITAPLVLPIAFLSAQPKKDSPSPTLRLANLTDRQELSHRAHETSPSTDGLTFTRDAGAAQGQSTTWHVSFAGKEDSLPQQVLLKDSAGHTLLKLSWSNPNEPLSDDPTANWPTSYTAEFFDKGELSVKIQYTLKKLEFPASVDTGLFIIDPHQAAKTFDADEGRYRR